MEKYFYKKKKFLAGLKFRGISIGMSAKFTPAKNKGRPPIGVTRSKVTITLPTGVLAIARKQAGKASESLSQFIARAVQNQTLSN